MEKMNKPVNGSLIARIVLSLILALGLWIYVDANQSPDVSKTFKDIEVEFINEDTGLANNGLMILEGYGQTVDVKLKAPRNVLYQLKNEDIRLYADTSTITEVGTQTLRWKISYPDNVIPSAIKISSASSYTVTVEVGDLYTKDVPVYCDVIGKVADGYFTGDLIVDPSYLTLRALSEDLTNVCYAKVSVDVTGATNTVIESIPYVLYDNNDQIVLNDNIRASTKAITVTLPVRTTKEVPLKVVIADANMYSADAYSVEILPETVTLQGESDKLRNVESITIATIYLEEVVGVQNWDNIEIEAPSGTIIISDAKKASFNVTVKGAEDRTFTIENITTDKVPEGFTATVQPADIVLSGTTSELERVKMEDITCTVDLSSVTGEGTYSIPMSITLTQDHEFVAVKGSYMVTVEVKASQE